MNRKRVVEMINTLGGRTDSGGESRERVREGCVEFTFAPHFTGGELCLECVTV